MNKQSFITILLTGLMSMIGAKSFAHDIEEKNSDNVTIYYKWINNNTELAVSYRGLYSSSYKDEYTGNVVIPESVEYNGNTYPVTTIGNDAFHGCSGLTSVRIPNSVTSIDDDAFRYCIGLTSVTIPNKVESIGENAFWGCSGLTSITISNSVTSIGKSAFHGCSGLTSITIPSSVESIGEYVFEDCSSLATIVSEIDDPFAIDHIASTSVTLIVPVGTKAAYKSTAGWSSFTNTIEFGEGGFVGSKFGIDGLIYTIGENNTAAITSASKSISGAVVIVNQVQLNGKKYDVTSIGENAFYNCNSLATVIIGNGLLSIGNNAFSKYSLMKVIWLTNTPPTGYTNAEGGINYVSNNAFNFSNKVVYPFLSSHFVVDGIRYVPVSPSERTCDAIDCLYDESAENINIAETVTNKGFTLTVKKVNPYTCYGNKHIKNVKLSLKGDIGNSAFYGCTGLKTGNVSNQGGIGGLAFGSCSALEIAELGQDVTSIGDFAFSGCSKLKSIVIPDGVASIGSDAFKNCTAMTSAKIGRGVETIKDYTFSGCSSLNILRIGSKVKTINQYAFSDCSALASVTLPKSVTVIKDYVFQNCTSLKKVIIVDSKNPLTLGSNGSNPIFSSCPLDSVYIGRNINYNTASSYGKSPFYQNTSLRAVKITNRETEISENEFYGCTNLQRVIIGSGVTTIGDWAFSGCSSLKYFAFGSKVQEIGQNAFSDCTSMEEIISKAATPPTCGTQALDDINKWNCKLYVPNGSMGTYQNAKQWKDFFYIDEGAGTFTQDESQDVRTGDANNDGDVDESDVEAIANYIMTEEENGFNFKNADVNTDNKVNAADIVILNDMISYESDPEAEEPVDPSDGKFMTDNISASFVTGAVIQINGKIISGSKFGVKFKNNSSQSVTLIKMQLNDAGTGTEGNNLLAEQVVVGAGQEVSYTIEVGGSGIYLPVISFTYKYSYYTFKAEDEWGDFPRIDTDPDSGNDPVDHSSDNLVTDKISASFVAFAGLTINGKITGGSKFGAKFTNNSKKSVTITKMQLNDAETGIEGSNQLTQNVVVAAGGEASFDNIEVGASGIYRPVISFTYLYNNTAYKAEAEYKRD